jgi:hypothetical protein
MAGSVRFWFYKQKTKKIESSPNRAKPKNRAKQEKTEPKLRKPSQTGKPSQTDLNQFLS